MCLWLGPLSWQGLCFEFGAVTVDPQTPSYDPSPLKQYLASLNVPYYYESQCEYYQVILKIDIGGFIHETGYKERKGAGFSVWYLI